MKKLAIFDLDGTLLDTLGDLAAACNYVMQRNGYPIHDFDRYRYMVGNGINKLIERALPAEFRSPERAAALRPEFIARYREHLSDHTRPYPGIVALLDRLEAGNVLLAVASNKYHEGTRTLVQRFFPRHRFVQVLGQREGVPVKPDPAIVFEILESAQIPREEALYIGDSDVDMLTASRAGVDSVGASWGFRPCEELQKAGATHMARTPMDIVKFL